jgi:hypothetical protein
MSRSATIETPTPPAAAKPTQLDLPWTTQDHVVFSRASERAHVARVEQRRPRQEVTPSSNRPLVHPVLAHPTVFVCVPRAVVPHYLDAPWADVLAAAERGVDGLAVVTDRPHWWRGTIGEPPPRVPDVAFLAEGQDNWRGRTVLYQQNW